MPLSVSHHVTLCHIPCPWPVCVCYLSSPFFLLLPILLPHYFHFILSYFTLLRSPFIVFYYFLLCSFPMRHFFIFQLFLNLTLLLHFYLAVDDMVDTAGTLCKAAEVLKEFGARRVFAFASHGVFSGTPPTCLTAFLHSFQPFFYFLYLNPYSSTWYCSISLTLHLHSS
jgi:Phosphoribosyl synthetase-associated domain